jgi:dihydrodipicolinate synthase/N-acetylneuraminate lyase
VNQVPLELLQQIRRGVVIPAMPLALTSERKLDSRRQKALARYYIDSGAGGLAVGVHTTQFAIRDPGVDLFQPVLSLVSAEVDSWSAHRGCKLVKIAGICGQTEQACAEAAFAVEVGYHAGLLSLGSLPNADLPDLLKHCRAVAEIIPVVGFYLQPAVGGRVLPYAFWRRFVEIENVLAIKIAPFNRYQTLDVVRAVYSAGRVKDIALYTGNDDSILFDLLTNYHFSDQEETISVRLVGGLLGQWAVWTRQAVKLLDEIHARNAAGQDIPPDLLTRAAQLTDANAAIFDAANQFAGCIPGIHYVLQRQGLLAGTWCLHPQEKLSPGQAEEIERVWQAYRWLNDDDFVRDHLDLWLDEG